MQQNGVDQIIEGLATALDPSLRTPLYEQLETFLWQRIEAGDLAEGMALPPEPELADRLGASAARRSIRPSQGWRAVVC